MNPAHLPGPICEPRLVGIRAPHIYGTKSGESQTTFFKILGNGGSFEAKDLWKSRRQGLGRVAGGFGCFKAARGREGMMVDALGSAQPSYLRHLERCNGMVTPH